MARMSIDDMMLRDPRVLKLAKQLNWSRRETIGALLDVFAIAYDRVTAVLPPEDVDIAADMDGFADRMVNVNLADHTRGGIRIRGASKRLEYLRTREESGRLGGVKSGETRRNNLKQNAKVTFAKNEGPANPLVPDNPSAPDVPIAPDNPLTKTPIVPTGDVGGSSKRGPKPFRPTPHESASVRVVLDKLSAQNGVRYSGTDEHTKLIVRQLRAGITEMQLRFVIGYCAIELGWKDDAERAKYLRPETLFGPQTIARYLDPATTWAEQQGFSRQAPQLSLVEAQP